MSPWDVCRITVGSAALIDGCATTDALVGVIFGGTVGALMASAVGNEEVAAPRPHPINSGAATSNRTRLAHRQIVLQLAWIIVASLHDWVCYQVGYHRSLGEFVQQQLGAGSGGRESGVR